MIVLTRNKETFFIKHPFFSTATELKFIEGDICSFDFPDEKIDFIIHAATEASVTLNLESPLSMFETIVNGTRRILDLAILKDVRSFFVY